MRCTTGFCERPTSSVRRLDPERPEDFAGMESCFDSALCVNVLEHVADPGEVIASVGSTIKPGGKLVLLVPNSPALFGTLDEALGHRRRFSPAKIGALLQANGFAVESVRGINKAGTPPWWLYSRVTRGTRISKPVLKLFDKTVWLWRRLDWLFPWPALSLVIISRKEVR